MDRKSIIRLARNASLILGLALLAPGAARAGISYSIRPLVKRGEAIGGVTIGSSFQVGALDNDGRLTFVTENETGQQMLVQAAHGRLVPIVGGGGNAPGGRWPQNVAVMAPVSANRRGNVVFSVDGPPRLRGTSSLGYGGAIPLEFFGLFLWDAGAQKLSPVRLPRRPADRLKSVLGSSVRINDRNEIVFLGSSDKDLGSYSQLDIYFLGRDATLRRVVQELPGHGKIEPAGREGHALSDAGKLIFPARGSRGGLPSRWVWEKGRITSRTAIATELPDGQKFADLSGIWANTRNRGVLVSGGVNQKYYGSSGLFRATDGKLTPVALIHRPLPGGGTLERVQHVSPANRMGQHALLAELEDGSQAIYRVDADGKLSLILREGAVTELGKIAHLGTWYNTPERGSYSGVSLNDKGQVALPIQTVDGIETVVVLTPTVQAAGPQAETTRTRAQEQHGEPAAVGTNEQDVATASLMRLRQLAKALMLYAQDSDEQFPPLKDAATAKKALLAYVRGEAVFVHPRTGEPYQPNPALSRQHLATIAEPWKTAAFYEARPAADGTRGVVFSDGHASRVTEAEWPEIKRASSLRFRAR